VQRGRIKDTIRKTSTRITVHAHLLKRVIMQITTVTNCCSALLFKQVCYQSTSIHKAIYRKPCGDSATEIYFETTGLKREKFFTFIMS